MNLIKLIFSNEFSNTAEKDWHKAVFIEPATLIRIIFTDDNVIEKYVRLINKCFNYAY